MNANAQMCIEAIIVLCIFIGVLCLGIETMQKQGENSKEKINMLNAKSTAIGCGILSNSFYANSTEEIKEFGEGCASAEKENEVGGKYDKEVKFSFSLAEKIEISQGDKKQIAISGSKHYWGD